MRIESIFVLNSFVIFLFTGAHGFRLYLDDDVSTAENSSSCKMVCDDLIVRPSTKPMSSSTSGDTMRNSVIGDDGRSIVRMTLFNGSQIVNALFAELSTTKNILTRQEDTSSVEGLLTMNRATIRATLFNAVDCKAVFVCHVLMSDGQLKVLTIDQSGETTTATPADEMTSVSDPKSDLYAQLVSLVEDLNAKVTNMDKKVDAIYIVEQDLATQIATMQSDLATVEQSIRNELTNAEQRVTDRIENIGARLERLSDVQHSLILAFASTEQRLVDKMSDIKQTIQLKTREELSQFEEMLAKQSENASFCSNYFLSSVRDDIKEFQIGILDSLSCNMSVQSKWINLEETCKHFINVSNGLENRSDKAIALIDSNGQNDTHRHGMTNLTEIIKEEMDNNPCTSEHSQTFLKHSQCRKNMHPISAPPQYPYPVCCPDENSILDTPYLCDSLTETGGWVIVQRRSTGKVSFYRDWGEYKVGFGSIKDDFWLGLESIYQLTKNGRFELRIELIYQGNSAYALYSNFSIGSESDNYRLSFESYSGTAGDSFTNWHNGMGFTTRDRDNDVNDSENCALKYKGAWWYHGCQNSNLNGQWQQSDLKGMRWSTLTDRDSASFSEMKIRRVDA